MHIVWLCALLRPVAESDTSLRRGTVPLYTVWERSERIFGIYWEARIRNVTSDHENLPVLV